MVEPCEFKPSAIEVRSETESITLTFRSGSGEIREIAIPRATVPGLISRLVSEIGHQTVATPDDVVDSQFLPPDVVEPEFSPNDVEDFFLDADESTPSTPSPMSG